MRIFKQRWIASASYAVLLVLLYSIAASQAIQSFAYKWTTLVDHEQYSLDKTFEGAAPKPYAYRLLIPAVINGIVKHTPQQWFGPVLERSRNALVATIGLEAAKINDENAIKYGLTLILNFLLLVFTLFTFRQLTKKIVGVSNTQHALVADVAPIFFVLVLTITYRVYNGFIYDHFELFALSIYLLLSWEKQWAFSIFTLALAILNKETAIFFPLFGLTISYMQSQGRFQRSDGLRFAVEFSVVLVGFALIRYMLRNYPGGTVEWHAMGNLGFWLSAAPLVSMTTPHLQVIPLPKPTNIIVIVAIIYSIFGFWSKKPPVIKALLVLSALINLPLFFLFSYRDEFRNLSLMFPFMYLAATDTILQYYRAEKSGEIA